MPDAQASPFVSHTCVAEPSLWCRLVMSRQDANTLLFADPTACRVAAIFRDARRRHLGICDLYLLAPDDQAARGHRFEQLVSALSVRFEQSILWTKPRGGMGHG